MSQIFEQNYERILSIWNREKNHNTHFYRNLKLTSIKIVGMKMYTPLLS